MAALLAMAGSLLRNAAGGASWGLGAQLLDLMPGGGEARQLRAVHGLPFKSTRRRRRKMFTNTDLAQFAVVQALAGRKAVEAIMVVRASGA